MSKKKLMLVDGNSLLLRGFHATARGEEPMLQDANGQYINGVQQVIRMIIELMKIIRPTHITVGWDVSRETTWRRARYPEYKGTRSPNPPEMEGQKEYAQNLLFDMGIFQYFDPLYEADDVLGTVSRVAEEAGDIFTYIVTSDGDALQLVAPRTCVIKPVRGVSEIKSYTEQTVLEECGVMPKQIPDLKGLVGDTGDNIPGVPGVGGKYAPAMLREYGTIEGLYERLDELKEHAQFKRYVKKLEEGKALAELSKELATIIRNMPDLQDVPMDGLLRNLDSKKCYEVLTNLYLNHQAQLFKAS